MAYRRGRKENDGKYLRLTGLWQSKKKDTLWSGKLRPEDVEKLIEKADEAAKADVALIFFLWENEKRNNKDADFTLQVTVAEEEVGGGRKSSRRSSRDRDDRSEREEERDNDRDNEDDEKEEEEEEKPRRGKKDEKPATKNRKASKDDW